MSTSYIMATILILSILCLTTVESVLRCWRCSTDMSNGEFCNDPFDPNGITEQQRHWSYVNCTYSVGVKSVNVRPVCKKLVQEIYGKHVIIRSCFYEDMDDPTDKCTRDTTSSTKTIYCETCDTDGCNGAPSIRLHLVLMLIIMLSLAVQIK